MKWIKGPEEGKSLFVCIFDDVELGWQYQLEGKEQVQSIVWTHGSQTIASFEDYIFKPQANIRMKNITNAGSNSFFTMSFSFTK